MTVKHLITALFASFLVWNLACETGVPVQETTSEPTVQTDASEPVGADTTPEAGKEPVVDTKVTEPTPDNSISLACRKLTRPLEGDKPKYEPFGPKVANHCYGTNHQDIKDIELVVFVGDSITKGTPPTLERDFYRKQLETMLKDKFGDIEIRDCSKWGAQMDDLLLGSQKQLITCLPKEVETKRTLIIMTMGGNDMQSMAKRSAAGEAMATTMKRATDSLKLFRDAMIWAKDKKRFPNGSFVIAANVYEFTDGTGKLTACPLAKTAGFTKDWGQGRSVFLHYNEQMVKIAVETQIDMIFILEHFCGHGLFSDDPQNACYLGPDTPKWFDPTCTHPSPEGHHQLAKMFMAVVNE
jgi:lysophospholipase L1-like esterase